MFYTNDKTNKPKLVKTKTERKENQYFNLKKLYLSIKSSRCKIKATVQFITNYV